MFVWKRDMTGSWITAGSVQIVSDPIYSSYVFLDVAPH